MSEHPLNNYHYAAKSITKMTINDLLNELSKSGRSETVVNEIERRNSARDWHLFIYGLNKDNADAELMEKIERPFMKYLWSQNSKTYKSTKEDLLWRYLQLSDALGAHLQENEYLTNLVSTNPRLAAIAIMSSSVPTVTQTNIISKTGINQASVPLIDNHTAELLEAKGSQGRLANEEGLLVLFYIMEALKKGYVWGSPDTFNIMSMRLQQDKNDKFMEEAAKMKLNPESFAALTKLPDNIMSYQMADNMSQNYHPSAMLGWYISMNPEDTNIEAFLDETPQILEWLVKNPAYNQYFDLVWNTIKKNTLSDPATLKHVLQQPSERNPFLLLFESSPEMKLMVMSFFTHDVDQLAAYSVAPQLIQYLIEQSLESPLLINMLREWDPNIIGQIPMTPLVRQKINQGIQQPPQTTPIDKSEELEDDFTDWVFEDFAAMRSWYKRAQVRERPY